MFNFISSITLVLICLGSTVVDSFIARSRIVTRCTSKAITIEHNEIKRSDIAHCKSWLVFEMTISVFLMVVSWSYEESSVLMMDCLHFISLPTKTCCTWWRLVKGWSDVIWPMWIFVLWKIYMFTSLTARLFETHETFDSSCSTCQRKALRVTSLKASSGGASSGPKKLMKSCTVCKGKGTNSCLPCAGSGDFFISHLFFHCLSYCCWYFELFIVIVADQMRTLYTLTYMIESCRLCYAWKLN